jgi:hypothetical protein
MLVFQVAMGGDLDIASHVDQPAGQSTGIVSFSKK